jgi:hypothetical protein
MASDLQLRRTPTSIDNSVPIIFWEATDLVAGLSVLGMGMILKLFFLGVVGCVVTLIVATKLRQGAKRGAAQHWLWFMGAHIDRSLDRFGLRAEQNDFIH